MDSDLETQSTSEASQLNVLVVGGSGLVGSEFVKEAQQSTQIKTITVLLRRQVDYFNGLDKVKIIVAKDSANWGRIVATLEPKPDAVFSALGAIAGTRGTNETQKQVDHDLNLCIAKAAKLAGAKVFMVVTSFNNRLISTVLPYFRMKQQVEDTIEQQCFDRLIILRPGPIVGDRSGVNRNQPPPFTVALTSLIAQWTYNTCPGSLLGWPIRASEIAQSSVYLLETHSSIPGKKVATSEEMFSLSTALDAI